MPTLCVYVCVCMWYVGGDMFVRMYVCGCIYFCVRLDLCVVCMYECACVCMHVCVCVCVRATMHVFVDLHSYAHVCVHVL